MKRSLVALLFLLGCAKSPMVSLRAPAPRPTARDYGKQHDRWTRHGQLMFDFDSALTVDATLLSREFRAAYTERFIDLYKVTESERDAMRTTADTEAAAQYEFHAEIATHAFELGDLANKKTVWRITLLDDSGREVQPSNLHEKHERKEFVERFFPHTNEFTRSWRLRFPLLYKDGTPLVTEATRALTLRFAGPTGVVDLVWKLGDPS